MTETRRYWLTSLLKIADPVLDALEAGKLRERMPVESKSPKEDRMQYTYLEAFGRTLVGLGAWIGCRECDLDEETLRRKYAEKVRRCIRNAVDPASPDFMNFSVGYQPLVDAAFLAQGILRAREELELYDKLDEETKGMLLDRMRATRTRKPHRTNWLLFGAMPEVLLRYAGAPDYDPMRVDYALTAHEAWYKGDGWYGDGPDFHFDYYNSFVIQPMLLDISAEVAGDAKEWGEWREKIVRRACHFATLQEHLISPEGTYPPVGRSLTYRFGAFQTLALVAARYTLEPEVTPAGVRCALTAVLKRTQSFASMTDEHGFLRVGVLGSQPGMGERYISTGSLYLCTALFQPLVLPDSAPFWSDPDEPWTAVKLWRGEDRGCEHALVL